MCACFPKFDMVLCIPGVATRVGALLLTVGLEHAEDLGAGDGADLSDTVGVTQDHTDLQGNRVEKANDPCRGSVKQKQTTYTSVGEAQITRPLGGIMFQTTRVGLAICICPLAVMTYFAPLRENSFKARGTCGYTMLR